MFQTELKEKLERIFRVRKVTYDVPSDSFEQDTLFIDVIESRMRPTKEKMTGRVTGALTIYSQSSKLPHGFFAQRIAEASSEDLKGFFFEPESTNVTSPSRIVNINETRVGFTYLYVAQYDPNQGELTSIEFEGD